MGQGQKGMACSVRYINLISVNLSAGSSLEGKGNTLAKANVSESNALLADNPVGKALYFSLKEQRCSAASPSQHLKKSFLEKNGIFWLALACS